MPFQYLCTVSEVENLASVTSSPRFGKEFLIGGKSVFIIFDHQNLFAYLNHCPHLGIPLNWLPDQFLDRDNELIHCSNHGALFTVNSGLCIAGPCHGQSLLQLETKISDEKYLIQLPI